MRTCVASNRIYVPGHEIGPDCSPATPLTTTVPPSTTEGPPDGGGGGCMSQIIARAPWLLDTRDETKHWTMQVLLPQYGGRLNQPFSSADYGGFLPTVSGGSVSGWCGVPANFPTLALGPSGLVGSFSGVLEKVQVNLVRDSLGFGDCQWRFGRGGLAYSIPREGVPLGEDPFIAGAGLLDNIVAQLQYPEDGTGPVQIDITANLIPLTVGGCDFWYGFPFYYYYGVNNYVCPVLPLMLSGPFHLRITGG